MNFTSFFIAMLGSMLLVPPLIRVSGRLHLMDAPDPRKMHERMVPRSGGIAIVLGAFLPMLLWLPAVDGIGGLMAGGAIIAVFGLLDDRIDLDYRWKFFGQILAAVVAMRSGVVIEYLPFAGLDPVDPVLAYAVTLLFMLGVTNAINFSDGLDGLAGGISLLTLATIAWLAFQTSEGGQAVLLVTLATMGGICGFLRYNNYPAVIFMGDVGSQFLGFMTAGLAILLTQQVNTGLNPALVLLLLGLPILDTLVVMIWRIRRGESPFLPDRNHFHHRLLEFGFRHYEAVSVIYLTQALLVTVAVLVRYSSDLLVVSIFAAFSLFVMVFFRWAKVTNMRVHGSHTQQEFVERRNLWLRQMSWLPHWSARSTEYVIGFFMLFAALLPREIDSALGMLALPVAGTFVLAAALPGAWQSNARRLALYVAAVCAVYVIDTPHSIEWAKEWVVNLYIVGLAGLLVVSIRVTRREQFRTTPLDMLVWFFVLAVLVFSEVAERSLFATDIHVGNAIVRLAVIFYAGELLFAKGRRYEPVVSALTATAMLIMAARGFGLLP